MHVPYINIELIFQRESFMFSNLVRYQTEAIVFEIVAQSETQIGL